MSISTLLVGNSGVGKTVLLKRFIEGVYEDGTICLSTIGLELRLKNKVENDQYNLKLIILDTAGQERYRNNIPLYTKGVDVIIICADITNKSSFANIPRWIELVNKNSDVDIPRIFVGTKCDIHEKRVVIKEEMESLYSPYFEVSAKDNIRVDEMFHFAARMALKNIRTENFRNSIKLETLKKVDNKSSQSSCC